MKTKQSPPPPGEVLPAEKVQEMFEAVDANGDGAVAGPQESPCIEPLAGCSAQLPLSEWLVAD